MESGLLPGGSVLTSSCCMHCSRSVHADWLVASTCRHAWLSTLYQNFEECRQCVCQQRTNWLVCSLPSVKQLCACLDHCATSTVSVRDLTIKTPLARNTLARSLMPQRLVVYQAPAPTPGQNAPPLINLSPARKCLVMGSSIS